MPLIPTTTVVAYPKEIVMCSVHVEFECDGEFPECYEGWEALLLAETERKQAWITRQREMETFMESVDNAMEAYYPDAF